MKRAFKSFLIFSILLAIHFSITGQAVVDFTLPDSSCVGAQITITNLTTGGATFFWSFCSGDANSNPTGVNFGNPGNLLDVPTYITLVKDGNNCYSFISCQFAGIIRYYHGTSFSHTPVSWTHLGTFGLLGNHIEGIQVKKENGNWYGFVCNNTTLVRLDFGASLANTPTAIDLGPFTGLTMLHGLVVIKEGTTWLAFAVDSFGAKFVSFNFGNSLINIPVLTDFGNFGIFIFPGALCLVQENLLWYGLILDGVNLIRLTFGNSLLNVPTAENLGNPGGFNSALGLSIVRDCDLTSGYFVNYLTNGQLGKLIFTGGVAGTVTGEILGNIGNLNQPHSFSEIFRQNDTLFSYITNRGSNTLTLLTFPPCNNASVPSSTQFNPPPFSYDQPGTYNVRLLVNEGLPDQVSLCKIIVIMPVPTVNLGPDRNICPGQSTTLDAGACSGCSYLWSNLTTGQQNIGTGQTFTTSDTGVYCVAVTNSYGCISRDTIQLFFYLVAPGITGNSTPCLDTLFYYYQTETGMSNYQWSISSGGTIISGLGTDQIKVKWNTPGNQYIMVNYTTATGCTASNPTIFPILVHMVPGPAGNINGPHQLCTGYPDQIYSVDSIPLTQTYVWQLPPGFQITNGQGTNTITISFDTSVISGDFYVNGMNLCGNGQLSPPFHFTVSQSPIVDAGPDQTILYDSTTILTGAVTGGSGVGYSYSWQPATLLTDNTSLDPRTLKLTHDTMFILTVTDLVSDCQGKDSVRIKVIHPEIIEDCLVFHNVITPNGDGLNDKWVIDCIENFPENNVIIFNIWGDEIIHFNNYDNVSQVWKGTRQNGQPLPDGTYYYILSIKNGSTFTGWILLRGL